MTRIGSKKLKGELLVIKASKINLLLSGCSDVLLIRGWGWGMTSCYRVCLGYCHTTLNVPHHLILEAKQGQSRLIL